MSTSPYAQPPNPEDPFSQITPSAVVARGQWPGSPSQYSGTTPHGTEAVNVSALERLQEEATEIRHAITDAAPDAAVSERTRKTDRTGSCAVTLDPDGVPEFLQIAPDWARKIRPGQFAAAVTEAANAARAEQLDSVAHALQGSQGQGLASGQQADHSDQAPHAAAQEQEHTAPRTFDVLIEDALKLFDEAQRFRPPQLTQGTGHAARGRFSLILTDGGGISCSADPQWVTGQSPATLSEAFRTAALAARTSLVRARSSRGSPPAGPAAALQDVFREVMTILQDPGRITDM